MGVAGQLLLLWVGRLADDTVVAVCNGDVLSAGTREEQAKEYADRRGNGCGHVAVL